MRGRRGALLVEVGNTLSLPLGCIRSSLICELRIDHMSQLTGLQFFAQLKGRLLSLESNWIRSPARRVSTDPTPRRGLSRLSGFNPFAI